MSGELSKCLTWVSFCLERLLRRLLGLEVRLKTDEEGKIIGEIHLFYI